MSTGTPSVSPPSPFHPLKGTSLNSRSTFFDLIYNEMPENTFSFWRTYTLLVLVHTLSLYLLYSLSVLIYFSKGASDCTPKLWEGVTVIKMFCSFSYVHFHPALQSNPQDLQKPVHLAFCLQPSGKKKPSQ